MNVKRWVIIFGSMKQNFALKYQWSSGSFRTYSVRGISAWQEDLTPTTKHAIEKFWANRLPETPCYDDSKPKFYVLSMFPYPSGQLHMGHVRVYTISDVMARFYRMNGKNVIHPMGWDAFGLPAENAARENNIAPSVWTYNNIDRMKNQLLRLGCSFDWNRELATCDAEYYKWTQSLFLKLHSRGMVYQREALVNWDPVDETVLADEQVDGQGRSWRSGAKVEKRWLKQWFIRSTQFAKALLEGLDDPSLIDWRDIIKLQQHWIGPCSGTTIDFDVVLGGEEEGVGGESRRTLTVWTEHPECLLGASFIAIRPNSDLHLLCKEKGILMKNSTSQTVGSNRPWQRLPCWAHHPITGQKLPLIALDEKCDDVMMDVAGFLGTHGCRLGLPGENSLDLKIAVNEGFSINSKMVDEKGCMLPSAGPDLSGLSVADARAVMCEKARALGVGGHHVSPSLKDWLISRQRYWGTPIPMVHCPNCGAVPVPPDQLPVLLPPPQPSAGGDGRGVPTLNRNEQWKQTSCPQCGGSAERETDTMDTFVDSSWYFLRYLDPKNASAPFCPEKAKKFMPVDLYIGGKEHAVLHLYYARFVSHFLHSEGLLPNPEPFRRMLVQGMIMGKTYRAKKSGKYLRASDVEAQGKKVFERATKEPVSVSWEKMSKSKGNGVEPSDMIEEHGADTTRLLVLADVAPTSHRKWMPETFPGIINWQRRLWLTIRRFRELRSSEELLPKGDQFESEEQQMWDSRNFYLKGATFNYSASHQLSVAISKMQGLSNALKKASPSVIQQGSHYERGLATLLILLAPMAPHFASELWAGFVTAPGRVNPESKEIDWESSVLEQRWPDVDYNYNLELIGKLNGGEFCRIKMPRKELDGLGAEDAFQMCLAHQSFAPKDTAGSPRKIVTYKYALYPGYQASVNILTEAGVSPKETAMASSEQLAEVQ